MFEHQTPQLLQLPRERVSELISCLIYCIQNPTHDVQEAGFRAILPLSFYLRMNHVPPTNRDLLEHLLTETMACLFVGGVDGESVSNACAAVHSLATILPACPEAKISLTSG
jgi:hypothetical protein